MPFRLSYGRFTILYRDAASTPSLMWDSQGVTPVLLDSTSLDELIPDACEALYELFQKDIDVGYRAINRLFEMFGPKWFSLLQQQNFGGAAQLWIEVLKPVRDWEQRAKKHIHKGTPYYFLGASYFYSSNFDMGFRYLFDAIEDDKEVSTRTNSPGSYKQAPAYMLASLVDGRRNYLFNEIVAPGRSRIGEFLKEFRNHTSSAMTIGDFDLKFLNKDVFEIPKLYFVYVLLQLMRLEKTWDPIDPKNDFVKMRNRDILLDLCLIIDEVIRKKPPGATTVGPAVFNVVQANGWLNSADHNAGDLNANLSPKVTGPTSPAPDIVVPALLDLTETYHGNSIGREMSWFLIVWHIRNSAAHDLSPHQVLVDRYHEIVQALMNALFFSV